MSKITPRNVDEFTLFILLPHSSRNSCIIAKSAILSLLAFWRLTLISDILCDADGYENEQRTNDEDGQRILSRLVSERVGS